MRLTQFTMPAITFSALAALFLVLPACGSGSSDTDGAPKAKPNQVTIKMFDNSFKPAQITVSAATTVTFKLPNVGVLPHNMHIASERGIYRESPWITPIINGGQTTQLIWEVPAQPGTYNFRCDVHEAEMIGTITVE